MPEFLARILDQTNPFSDSNVAIYFGALFVYLFTAVSIWLSDRWAWRIAYFLLNQIVTIGFIGSWTLTLQLSRQYAIYAIAMTVVALVAAIVPRYISHRRELSRKYYF